jgi:hypothetical protein
MSLRPDQVTADGNGGFAVDIVIFHHDVRGARKLGAAPVAGAVDKFEAPLPAEFLVVPGSLQPSGFTGRR